MNDQDNKQAERWWQVWLDEIESPQPNLERATRAAQQLTAAKPSKAQPPQGPAPIPSHTTDPPPRAQGQAQFPHCLPAQRPAPAAPPAGAQQAPKAPTQSATKFAEVRT